MRRTTPILVLAVLTACIAATGCGGGESGLSYTRPEMMDRGLVIVLPGIEGESGMNRDIRRGLERAGVDYAIPIYNWGRPVPVAGLLLNQMDFIGNRLAGGRVARMIVEYQRSHPGKPVYLVGHSGGGGVAVFAAEALPEENKVEGLILLSASISAGYDLNKALARTNRGILNVYHKADVLLLGIGTAIAGNVDGVHGPSAGAGGFEHSFPRLYQIELKDGMSEPGADPHAAATKVSFVASYVAPWVEAAAWPPAKSDGSRLVLAR